MLTINIQNIEELIFNDSKIHKLLPEFQNTFFQWKFGKRNNLRTLVKNSVFEFFDLIEDRHIKRLEGYFGEPVTINTIDHHLIKNVKLPISNELQTHEYEGYENFTAYRDGDHLYLCFWR
jgi:hypothetical protein